MKKERFLILAACLIATILTAQQPTATTLKKNEEAKVISTSAQPTVIKKSVSRTIEKTINGKRFELTLTNDVVSEVKINNKRLNKDFYGKYQSQIDELRSAAYEMDTETPFVGADKSVTSQDIQTVGNADLSSDQKAANAMIEETLLADGLIKDRAYRLELTEKAMTLDGKTQPKETHDKYINIYYTYSGETRCNDCRFKFKISKQAK